MRVRVHTGPQERRVTFTCPGCGGTHQVPVERWMGVGPLWTWNGSLEAPTLAPSLRVRHGLDGAECCHLTVTDGVAYFYGDSTHGKRDQSLPLPLVNGEDDE